VLAYDAYARPAASTSPYGSATNVVYSNSPATRVTTTDTNTTGTVNNYTYNKRWTRETLDGFGRTVKVETGYTSTTGGSTSSPVISGQSETEYAPCGCTPMGKPKRTSQTHAPGATIYWTTYSYDALGRTVAVSQPNNLGQTTYAYSGNTVTVTDAAGKWKTFTTDAMGNLTQVTEPNPAGGANFLTYYTYNTFNQLLTVSMTRPKVPANGTNVTQTRTFVYDSNQRVQSVTNPENGTTSYTYNADGTMNTKTDAKGQVLSYFYDSLGRLTQVKNGGVVLRTFTYDANGWGQNLAGRVARVDYGGGKWSELYSYHPAGGRTAKRLSYTYGQSTQNLDAFWSYNTAGQVTGVKYPDTTILDSYANPQVVTGDTFTNSFDPMGRPKDLTIAPGDGSTPYQQAQGATYGPSGELTSVSYVGAGGYIYESRSYNARMQLTGLSALGAYYSIASIGYNYYDVAAGQQPDTTKNNSKVGQMSSTILGSTEVVNYKYDSLNRLIAAYTNDTSSVGWGLAWDYDGFGNRLSQTVTQGTAQPMTTGVDQTTNRIGGTYDANGNMTNGGAYTYDVENRMIGGSNPYVALDEYDYAPDNKRIYKKTTNNSGTFEYVYFYSGSKKLATYQIVYYGYNNSQFYFAQSSTNIYFGGKLIQAEDAPVVTDRLGTVIWDGVKGGHKYFPYGEERTSTSNESTKFGTYFRDGTTGLDYAVNRYFSSSFGRFMSADPLSRSGHAVDPSSWNRFAYGRNDPVNQIDPLGLEDYPPDGCTFNSVGNGVCTATVTDTQDPVPTYCELYPSDEGCPFYSLGGVIGNNSTSDTNDILSKIRAKKAACDVLPAGSVTEFTAAPYLGIGAAYTIDIITNYLSGTVSASFSPIPTIGTIGFGVTGTQSFLWGDLKSDNSNFGGLAVSGSAGGSAATVGVAVTGGYSFPSGGPGGGSGLFSFGLTVTWSASPMSLAGWNLTAAIGNYSIPTQVGTINPLLNPIDWTMSQAKKAACN